MFRTLRHLGRLFHVARTLSRHSALIPEDLRRQMPWTVRSFDAVMGGGRRAGLSFGPAGVEQGRRLARALEQLGPSYIKLGQLLATRTDLLGAPMAMGLAGLHDRLPPFANAHAERILLEEFGLPSNELYQTLGRPMAAASIAQVYKARTLTGKPFAQAAVKILRPGIERTFLRDVESLHTAARLANRLSPEAQRLRPLDVVRTLEDSVRREMDLRLEAAAASELAQNTANDPEFRVPMIDWERTSRRVLTSEWIEGIPLSDRDALIKAGVDRTRLARIVLQSFLRHAMRDGFFHADMHPGNLFVDAEERLVAVDFGIMGRLDRGTRRFMAETLYGFITRDYERVADVHFEAGYVPADQNRDDFALALRSVGEPIWGRTAAEMSIARLLTQLFETTRRFNMALQPGLLLLQKTMVAAEGVARDLDSSVSIWDCARPVVEDWMAEEIGPQGRLRDAAEAATSLGRLAARAPDIARDLETAAHSMTAMARAQSLAATRKPAGDHSAIWTALAVLLGVNIALLLVLLLGG